MADQVVVIRAKLQDWMLTLSADVRDLVTQRAIYSELREIGERNPALHRPTELIYWAVFWYSTSVTVGVRRLVDSQNRAISYRNILTTLKKNPGVITREWFSDVWEEFFRFGPETPDEIFDRIVGRGAIELTGADATKDLAALEAITAGLKTYVDQRVAHRDANPHEVLPTFAELHSAIDHVCELHTKYFTLLKGEPPDINPNLGPGWREVLRIPWIPGAQ